MNPFQSVRFRIENCLPLIHPARRGCAAAGVGLAIALLLPGCSTSRNRTITSSFDEVTSGQRQARGAFPQIYAASVNGLLPFAEPGELYFYPDNRGILGAIGISSYTGTNVTTTNCPCAAAGPQRPSTVTYKLVREYPSSATLDDLGTVRSNLAKASALMVKGMRLQRAAVIFLNATNEAQAAQAATFQKQATETLDRAEASLAAVRSSLTQSNIVLFQWTASKDSSLGMKVGSMVGLSSSSQKSLQGYALVAGFRTSTLFVGEDLVREIAENMTAWSPRVNRGLGVPTFTIEGAQVMYFSQSEFLKEVQAALKAHVSHFRQSAELLKDIDQVEVNLLARQLESVSNSGLVKGPACTRREIVPMSLPWGGADKAAEPDCNGWSPFYSVITRTKDVYEATQRRSTVPSCAGCRQ